MAANNLKIAFRADSALHIGTGHVMRCLTLANALKQQGALTVFVCREHEGHLVETIMAQGHECHLLPKPSLPVSRQPDLSLMPQHSKWLGETWQRDVGQTTEKIGNQYFDWLVVDHYALDYQWERAMRGLARKIMVIDDLVDRSHDCELLLDQTLGRAGAEYTKLVPQGCKLLCGSQYALLRLEFMQWREYSLERRREPQLKNLLVNMGGVDADNVTGEILTALAKISLPSSLVITVVLGLAAPHLASIQQQAQSMPLITEIKTRVDNMAEIMANSDLAIGAAGATSWERCCLGLPTLMLILASNQIAVASALQAAGAVTVVDDAADLAGNIYRIFEDPDVLKTMIDAAAGLVQGHGTAAVIESMGALHG